MLYFSLLVSYYNSGGASSLGLKSQNKELLAKLSHKSAAVQTTHLRASFGKFSFLQSQSPLHLKNKLCLLSLIISDFRINVWLLLLSTVFYEWKYYIKAREVISRDYQTWIGRKSENSGDLKFIKITYVWVHAWCSVFRFLVSLMLYWTKLSLSR